MGNHVVVHLKGVLRKPTSFLVMAVAATLEVTRRFEIADYGVYTVATGGAKDG